jgi:putative ABC transport system permease protein
MGSGLGRLRDALVAAEVALAFVLAIGAAILVRELVRLRNTTTGMATRSVVTFHVGRRRTPRTDVRRYYEIADRAARLPGTEAAGFSQMLPLQNWGWGSNSSAFTLRGQRESGQPVYPIELRFVTPGYFQALGIAVVHGRAFTSGDDSAATPVIMINQTLSRRYFGDADPSGTVMNRGMIVGVIGDVRQASLDSAALPEIYYPIAQNWSQVSELGLTLVVRTRGRPESVVDAVRAVIREVAPDHAVFNVRTMEDVISDSLSEFTLYVRLMAALAGLALVLAVTGTYGVVSYVATSRVREFAIRSALGADSANVRRLMVAHGLRFVAIGLVVGLWLAFASTPLLNGLPVTVRPPSVATVVPVALAIVLIAAAACLGPAIRASRANPMDLLRDE